MFMNFPPLGLSEWKRNLTSSITKFYRITYSLPHTINFQSHNVDTHKCSYIHMFAQFFMFYYACNNKIELQKMSSCNFMNRVTKKKTFFLFCMCSKKIYVNWKFMCQTHFATGDVFILISLTYKFLYCLLLIWTSSSSSSCSLWSLLLQCLIHAFVAMINKEE